MATKKFIVKNGLQSDGNVLINKTIDNTVDQLQIDGTTSVNDQIKSTLATGTSPFSVVSTTLVDNLNADLLDGQEGSYFLDSANFTGTPPNDYITLGTQSTGNYVATIAGTANEVEVSGSGSETAAVTVGLPNDVTISNELTVTTGLFTPLIDTADSSALTITPATTFSSDILVENDVVVTNKVTATTFIGDGSQLTGIGGNTSYVTLSDTNVAGQAANTLNKFDGAEYIPTSMTEDGSGNVTITGQVNVSTIDTADSSAITITPAAIFSSDVTVQNDLVVTNKVTATEFYGDGSNLTGLVATFVDLTDTNVSGQTTNTLIKYNGSQYVPTSLSEDGSGNLTVSGQLNVSTIDSADSSAISFTPAVSFNSDITVQNDVVVTNKVTATEFIGDGSQLTNLPAGNLTGSVPADFITLGTDTNGNYVRTATGTINEVEVQFSGSESADIQIGLPNDVTIGNNLTVTTSLFTPLIDTADSSALTITPAVILSSDATVQNDLNVTNDVIIGGNLTVQGTTTQVDSNVVNIGDSIITLNSDETGTPSQNAGLEVERGTSTNVQLIWNESTDKWQVTEDGSNYYNILTSAGDSVALGTDTTGDYIATIAGTANEVEVTGSGGETAAVTIGLPNDVTIGNNLTVTTSLFTPLIDTADSSGLTITPATTFSSDITVENDIIANNKIVVTDTVNFANHSYASSTVTTSSTAQTTLASVDISEFAGAEFFVSSIQGSARHITKLLVTHDGSTAYATEYGEIITGASLATYDVDIVGGVIRLRVTPASGTSTKFNVSIIQLNN